MRKRSNRVALAIVGAASFALAGCTEEQVDATAFPDLASCTAEANRSGAFSTADCQAAFDQTKAVHLETAPRFADKEACEAEYGVGSCGSEAEQMGAGGSGSIFMPLMMGMLLGNLMGGFGRSGAMAQPMYKTADGKFTTPSGNTSFSSNQGATKLSPQQFNKAPTTVGKPPMTKASPVSRGGFGSTGARTGSSFGG